MSGANSASRLRLKLDYIADAWFDLTRNVRTRGELALEAAGVDTEEQRDSEMYQAPGAAYIRRAILDAGLKDFSSHAFIDMGSGKGRALFVAAEFPFQRVLGIEFSPLLHQQAIENIKRFHPATRGCHNIISLQANAREFPIPPGKLVLFFFNPFGAETMREVMHNLQDSLWRSPRHVVIILLCPQCANEVMKIEGMKFIREGTDHQIFEVG